MTQDEPEPSGQAKQVHVELLIVHPTLDPAEISGALGLEAEFPRRAGDQRITPKGTILPGTYPDTRWRHCVEYTVTEQWFASEVTRLVEHLAPHKTFFAMLKATGGKATLIIQTFGDGYLGDVVPLAALATMVDLELDLGIECFA